MLKVVHFASPAVDTEPPVITVCPADITETVLSGEQGSIVNFPQPSATDNSGTASLSNNPEFYPGFYFPLGTTTVTYVFTDNVPLTASCTFTVTVISGMYLIIGVYIMDTFD